MLRSLGTLALSPGQSVPSFPRVGRGGGAIVRVRGQVVGGGPSVFGSGRGRSGRACVPPGGPPTPQPPSPYIITLKSP